MGSIYDYLGERGSGYLKNQLPELIESLQSQKFVGAQQARVESYIQRLGAINKDVNKSNFLPSEPLEVVFDKLSQLNDEINEKDPGLLPKLNEVERKTAPLVNDYLFDKKMYRNKTGDKHYRPRDISASANAKLVYAQSPLVYDLIKKYTNMFSKVPERRKTEDEVAREKVQNYKRKLLDLYPSLKDEHAKKDFSENETKGPKLK